MQAALEAMQQGDVATRHAQARTHPLTINVQSGLHACCQSKILTQNLLRLYTPDVQHNAWHLSNWADVELVQGKRPFRSLHNSVSAQGWVNWADVGVVGVQRGQGLQSTGWWTVWTCRGAPCGTMFSAGALLPTCWTPPPIASTPRYVTALS